MEKKLSSEEIRKRYYEDKAFNELKDTYFDGMYGLERGYGKYNIDCKKVYRKIVNYRIKTFGTSYMPKPDSGFYKTADERLNDARKASKRHRDRFR